MIETNDNIIDIEAQDLIGVHFPRIKKMGVHVLDITITFNKKRSFVYFARMFRKQN